MKVKSIFQLMGSNEMNVKTIMFIAILISLLFSFNSYANGINEHCTNLQKRDKPAKYLELYEAALNYGTQTCINLISGFEGAKYSSAYILKNVDDHGLMVLLSNELKTAFPEDKFPNSIAFANSWLTTPTSTPANVSEFRRIILDPKIRINNDTGKIETTTKTLGRYIKTELVFSSEDQQQQSHCASINGGTCTSLLKEIAASFNIYNHYITQYKANLIDKTLKKAISDWDAYSKNAPSLGLVSIWATTAANRAHFYEKEVWPGPPPFQVRALELSVVYDHMPTAADGNQSNAGVAVEWLGFNDWKNETLPWGVGIASVYVDRAEQKKLGLGLIFHIKNEYSFGIVKRGDEKSFFINFNLSEWLGEQNTKLGHYKNDLKEQADKFQFD